MIVFGERSLHRSAHRGMHLITITGGLTWRSAKTPRNRDEHRCPLKATLLRFAKWVVCTIITNAPLHKTTDAARAPPRLGSVAMRISVVLRVRHHKGAIAVGACVPNPQHATMSWFGVIL